MLFFCNLERNFFIIYKFFYEVTGYVETGTGYIVVGTSLSCVDLKEFVAVVADIIFDIRKAMPYLGKLFFNDPSKELNLIGVGGTKGKSTTAYYVKAIVDDYLASIGKKESAVISSIDVYDGVTKVESHITTPENIELLQHFRNAVDSDIAFLISETRM